MFLNRRDVANYRQQIAEVRQTSEDDYAIALMPIHQIQCLFSMQKIGVSIIHTWDAIVYDIPYRQMAYA